MGGIRMMAAAHARKVDTLKCVFFLHSPSYFAEPRKDLMLLCKTCSPFSYSFFAFPIQMHNKLIFPPQ
jgi:hypothetical protein